MAKHIHIHLPTKFTVAKTKTKDQDYKRDAAGKFAEGDRVKADANYGGKAGHVESSIGSFHVVKHDDGSKASYHESNLKRQPSGTTVPHAKAYLKPGGEVFTTHRSTPFKATYIGPDHGAGPNHHEIKVGNSRVSVPEHELHATREAAIKYNGG